MEVEANLFAVMLLIPEDLLINELNKGFDLSSDDDATRICNIFQVSKATLATRLMLLNEKYPKGLPI